MKTLSLKRWYQVHKWTSLVCTLFMLLLCLTGLPLIFHDEIHYVLEDHGPAEVPAGTPRMALDDIVARARAERPDEVVQFVSADDGGEPVWYLGMGETADAPEVTVYYSFDAHTGDILDAWTPDTPDVMDIIFRLHYDMFAGLPGTLFLGFMGLLLATSLVSGVVLYAPFMRKLDFGTVRRGRSAMVKWLDLHNLIGIVTLAWLTVVALTGVINTLAIPIFGYWQQTELAAMVAPYKNRAPVQEAASVDGAIAAAGAAMPGRELSFIAFPGNDFASPHHYAAYMRGQTPLTSKLLQPILIDARSLEITDSRELPWYASTLLLSQPLHFGDYGGLPLKILWALLDLLAIFVLVSGLYLWLKKRNDSFENWWARMTETNPFNGRQESGT